MNIKIISTTALAASLVALGATGCRASNAAELEASRSGPIVVAPTPTPVAPATGKLAVVMTSATLGDDCGEGAPLEAPEPAPGPAKRGSLQKPSRTRGVAAERRACEQTSMQLSITSPADLAPGELRVKRVEVYDDTGKLVGALTPRSPSMWASGSYVAWDQKIAPGRVLSVSYPLTQPDWSKVSERFNKSYTIKAIVTVSGKDHALERDVYVAGHARLPPGAVT